MRTLVRRRILEPLTALLWPLTVLPLLVWALLADGDGDDDTDTDDTDDGDDQDGDGDENDEETLDDELELAPDDEDGCPLMAMWDSAGWRVRCRRCTVLASFDAAELELELEGWDSMDEWGRFDAVAGLVGARCWRS